MRAWKEFVERQEKSLGVETTIRWLKTLKIVDFDAGNLYLAAKDSFQIMWFREHIRPKLESELINENGRPIRVHLTLGGQQQPIQKPTQKKKKEQSFELSFDDLDPHALFGSFILKEADKLTFRVMTELTGWGSDEPQVELATFNPIFISGPAGCGKTHLLMATAHALREQGIKALYARAETFTQHVVGAIREGEMHRFRNAYRNIDVLLIDNVQVFSRKGATQEELFHTFNTLHVAGKQIILAANVTPQELQHVEPRLVSRFEWGISLQLAVPDREQLQKILVAKAKSMDYPLPGKVETFLMENFGSSTISLTRALEALLLRSHLQSTSGAMSVPLAQSLLADLLREEKQHIVTPDKIIGSVAEHFGIKSDDILGKSQRRECVTPRKIAMYLCRKTLDMPFVKIGDTFGRDHSTVMTSVRAIDKVLDSEDRELAGAVTSIKKTIQNRSDS